MRDIMVDLETLGTVPGSVILSIGAVAFDTDGYDEQGFYCVVNRASCEDAFLSTSAATLAWWQRQSIEAQDVLTQSMDATASLPLPTALARFNDYLRRFGGVKEVRLWGNGSDFDNALLACAYDAAAVKAGHVFWNNRCYRTLKNLAPSVELAREGTYHNALDDARSQAQHLIQIMKVTGMQLN